MAPPPITEDYYMILEVDQAAAPQLIVSSYKRLALKLHPDRNTKHNATAAFQLLAQAYETLKDESKRRSYDLIYPSITRRRTAPHNTQTPCPTPPFTPRPDTSSDAAQIAAIQKSMQERGARWRTKRTVFDASIFELQRCTRRIEQEIRNLNSILAAEAAEEAQKNSWATWLLSPMNKRVEESEEEKARKDRRRQERRIEKDMKERRLESNHADLKKEQMRLRKAKEEIDDADLVDSRRIAVIQAKILANEKQEREEREKVERETKARLWKQQQDEREKKEREAAEMRRKQYLEKRAAELKQQEQRRRAAEKKQQEEIRAAERKRQAQRREAELRRQANTRAAEQKRQEAETKRKRKKSTRFDYTNRDTFRASPSTCRHDGWWPKVQGRTACPECYETWPYLLECPGCEMKACPKCQAAIRPRMPRNAARAYHRSPPVRTPSPDFSYHYYDDDSW